MSTSTVIPLYEEPNDVTNNHPKDQNDVIKNLPEQVNDVTKNSPEEHNVVTENPPDPESFNQTLAPPEQTAAAQQQDQPYGWVIVGASFIASLITEGVSLSFGVVFTELLGVFHRSRSETVWVGALFVSVPMLFGPLSSILTNKVGCRWTTVAGAVVASIGCFTSAYTNSPGELCATFGIVGGVGIALILVPSMVVVAYNFKKRRALATGIAVAGTGTGTLIFAPLTEFLIEKYSWRTTFKIMAGIMLVCIVCGLLYTVPESKPSSVTPITELTPGTSMANLTPITSERKLDPVDTNITPGLEARTSVGRVEEDPLEDDIAEVQSLPVDNSISVNKKSSALEITPSPIFIIQERLPNQRSIYLEPVTQSLFEFPTAMESELNAAAPFVINDIRRGMSLPDSLADHRLLEHATMIDRLPCSMSDSSCRDKSGREVTESDTSQERPVTQTHDLNQITEEEHPLSAVPAEVDLVSKRHCKRRRKNKGVKHHNNLMVRSDLYYRGSLTKEGLVQSYSKVNSAHTVSGDGLHARQTVIKMEAEKEASVDCIPEKTPWWKELYDPSIFTSYVFDYFCLHCFLMFLGYSVPYIFIVDNAHGLGFSTMQGSILVSIAGACSTVGQIVMGFIGDMPKVDALVLYAAVTSLAGAATLVVPALKTYIGLAIYCGVYGFFSSANYALTTIILVELLGMDRLSDSFGITSMAEGVATLVGLPFAAWLCDTTGSYDVTFYFAGSIIFVSGVMLAACPALRRYETRKREVVKIIKNSHSTTTSAATSRTTVVETNEHITTDTRNNETFEDTPPTHRDKS